MFQPHDVYTIRAITSINLFLSALRLDLHTIEETFFSFKHSVILMTSILVKKVSVPLFMTSLGLWFDGNFVSVKTLCIPVSYPDQMRFRCLWVTALLCVWLQRLKNTNSLFATVWTDKSEKWNEQSEKEKNPLIRLCMCWQKILHQNTLKANSQPWASLCHTVTKDKQQTVQTRMTEDDVTFSDKQSWKQSTRWDFIHHTEYDEY